MTHPFADLHLEETARWRPVAVVAPEATTTADPGAAPEGGPIAPWAAVEVDLLDPRGTVRWGLSEVRAAYDGGLREVRLEVGGRTVRRRRVPRPAPGSTLGFALCECQATVLVREPGAGWRPLLTERDRVRAAYDLRDPAVLASQRWAWSAAAGVLGEVRHGPFGMAGLRDPQLVRHADGTPYVEDGRHFLTWTCAGLGGFRQAHWGVFALEVGAAPGPTTMVRTAQLFSRHGGRLHGDHAGALVRDGGRWLVAVSSWGSFSTARGVHARRAVSTEDLLHGRHLVDTEPLGLPVAPGVSTWDPSLRRDGEGWLVAHVAAPSVDPFRFHPALARTTGADPFSGLRPAGAAARLEACEGPQLVHTDGRTWLVASDGDRRAYPVLDTVADVDGALREVGVLDAAYGSNIPHPLLLRDPGGDGWAVLGFDGTPLEPRLRHSGRRPVLGYGTHGDVVWQTGPTTPDTTRATRDGARR